MGGKRHAFGDGVEAFEVVCCCSGVTGQQDATLSHKFWVAKFVSGLDNDFGFEAYFFPKTLRDGERSWGSFGFVFALSNELLVAFFAE